MKKLLAVSFLIVALLTVSTVLILKLSQGGRAAHSTPTSPPASGPFEVASGVNVIVAFPGTPIRETIVLDSTGKPHPDLPENYQRAEGFQLRMNETQFALWVVELKEYKSKLKDHEIEIVAGFRAGAGYLNLKFNAFGQAEIPYETVDGFRTSILEGFAGKDITKHEYQTSIKIVMTDEWAFILRVVGKGMDLQNPVVKDFFQSLQIPNTQSVVQNPNPLPTDDLRLLARLGTTTTAAFATRSSHVYGCTTTTELLRSAEHRAAPFASDPHDADIPPPDSNGKVEAQFRPPEGFLTRWNDPTFESAKSIPIAALGYRMALDEQRNRIVIAAYSNIAFCSQMVHHQDPARPGDLHIYDFGIFDAKQDQKNDGLKPRVITLGKTIKHLSFSPDGKYLSAFYIDPPTFVKFDAETLKPIGHLTFPLQSNIVVREPGKDVFYLAKSIPILPEEKQTSRYYSNTMIVRIDESTLKTTDLQKIPGACFDLAVTQGGQMMFAVCEGELYAIDLRGNAKTRIRIVTNPIGDNGYLLASPDGARLYFGKTGGNPVDRVSVDGWELIKSGQTREIARQSASQEKSVPGGFGIISHDGKCLIAKSGLTYWLSGAGPLPKQP